MKMMTMKEKNVTNRMMKTFKAIISFNNNMKKRIRKRSSSR